MSRDRSKSDGDDYQPSAYWSSRLAEDPNVRGTGHISYSEGYNRWLYRAKRRALDRVLGGESLQGKQVLDLGSGMGWVVAYLTSHGATVEGCDVADPALTGLRERFPEVTFFRAELGAQAIPRPDAHFDLVTALDVLYHLPSDEAWSAALAEIGRVLRPGGQLVVSDGFGESDVDPAPHVRLRSQAHWRREAARASLEVQRLVPLYRWLSRDREHPRWSRVPDSIRGPLEYALERSVPTKPHMACAALKRTPD